jgi:hypothetical protein
MLTRLPSIVNAPNKVPQHQKFYQQAYAQHTRLWKIVRNAVFDWRGNIADRDSWLTYMTQGPRSNVLMLPYQFLLWGTFSGMFNS